MQERANRNIIQSGKKKVKLYYTCMLYKCKVWSMLSCYEFTTLNYLKVWDANMTTRKDKWKDTGTRIIVVLETALCSWDASVQA